MAKGRSVPSRTPREQAHIERRAALISGDIQQLRAWATKWRVPLIETTDESLEETMHRVRTLDDLLPRRIRQESERWLAARATPQPSEQPSE